MRWNFLFSVGSLLSLVAACSNGASNGPTTGSPVDGAADDAATDTTTPTDDVSSPTDSTTDSTVPGDTASPTDTGPGPKDSAADLGVDTAPPADTGTTGSTLRFLVFGDSRDNPDLHQTLLDSMSKMNPALILDTGDLWAGYPSTSKTWATITTSNANIATLLNTNMYLVSRGNHESVSELLAFKPTLTRGGKETYSFTVGNAFFVSVGMDPAKATTFLSTELASAASTAATWRFVYSHYPIYDSGDGHGPVTGISAVESLCDKYHVTAFFSGHEHIYERFNQIAGGKVVDTTDAFKASKGTVYVVSGGGGAPFYTVTTTLPQEHVNKTSVNHYMLVDLTATTMSVQTLDTGNAVIDRFQIAQ